MINELIKKIKEKNAPIVVGLDPNLDFIPKHIIDASIALHGETLNAASHAIWLFNKEIIDSIYDLIPAVKPQIAMYEQYGIPGLVAYEKTINYCKEKGLIVIGDIKRGDIGSTSLAYANGHIGKVKIGTKMLTPFKQDFITVNPYLGIDGIDPFIDVCNENNKGLFVLVKTSNPSSGEFQDQLIDGVPLYEVVGKKVSEWGKQTKQGDYNNVGAVVGATYPKIGKKLREIMPNTFILVPGYGVQGGTGKDLVHYFDQDKSGAIISSSRGIIAAYTLEQYKHIDSVEFAKALRMAVIDMIEDINTALDNR